MAELTWTSPLGQIRRKFVLFFNTLELFGNIKKIMDGKVLKIALYKKVALIKGKATHLASASASASALLHPRCSCG